MRILILAFLLPLIHALSECQQCCSPGGDCSKAFHGQPGTCCGTKEDAQLAFCCPDVLATNSRCWECHDNFKCYNGVRPAADICASSGGSVGGQHTTVTDADYLILGLCTSLLIFAGVAACLRMRMARSPLATQTGVPMTGMPVTSGTAMATAMPMAKPGEPSHAVEGMPTAVAHPLHSPGYPTGFPAGSRPYPVAYPGGGGVGCGAGMGGNTMMAGGMGFLGGMMVGEMMADSHGGYGGGYDGGGDGGDFGGGGDMGFSADM